MRDAFHEDLDPISDQLVEMTRLAGSAIARATTALLDADLALAESVIAADEQIDRHAATSSTSARIDLLARQQPVATDLRIVVTSDADERRPGADGRPGPARRQGGPAALPRLRRPRELRATVLEMGQVAERIVAKAGVGHRRRDVALAVAARAATTTRWTACTAQLFTQLLDGSWPHGIEAAVDITLVGRYYERFADHAVSVARRVVYLVTGEWHTEAELDGEE